MRSNLVKLTPELFDQDLRIDPLHKPLHRETFVAKLTVEGFSRSILPRFSRIDTRRIDICEFLMAERQLYRPKILGAPIDQRRFCPSERVRPVARRIQTRPILLWSQARVIERFATI